MIEARMPDGAILRFPAGTADDVIDRAAREYIGQSGQPAAPRAPAPGIGERVAMGLGDPLRGAEQISARAQAGNTDGGLVGRFLRRNPNLAAVMDAGAAAVPLPTPEAVDARIQRREADYQERRGPDAGTDWARIGGNVAATLPAALAMPAGSSLVGSAVAGAAQGAALNALQPVTSGDFADEKKAQTETGAMLGAVAGPLGYIIGRALNPRLTPEAQLLAREGVQMTPGQMAGGTARRLEDVATSIPFVGETVRMAQRETMESFNRAAANRVLRSIGVTVPENVPAGRQMVDFVDDAIGGVYNSAAARVNAFAPDAVFVRDLAGIGQSFLTPQSRAAFNEVVRDRVLSRLQNAGAQIDGPTYQTIRSELGRLNRLYRASQAPHEQEMAGAFLTLRSAFDDLLERTNPAVAPDLAAANNAYAAFVRLSDAAGRAGATEGVFSPAQLASAVRSNDRSVRHRDYAAGRALLQDLSDAAVATLPRAVADSGTPERAAAMGVIGGGLGYFGAISPLQALAAGALYGSYLPPAQRAISAAVTAPRGPVLQATGDALARSGGAVSVPLGAMMLAPPPPQLTDQRR